MRLKRVLGFILVIAMAFTAGVGASSLQKNVTALQDYGIKIKVDGSELYMDGKAPLMYEGTTYIPVRNIAEAVDKPVKWDNDTRTVILGENTGNKTKLSDTYLMYEKSVISDKDKLTLGKHSVDEGVVYDMAYSGLDLKDLDGQFNTVTFTLITNFEKDQVLKVYNKDVEYNENPILLFETPIEKGNVKETYTVNILGLNKVDMQVQYSHLDDYKFIFGDVYFE